MIILHDSNGKPYYEAIEYYCEENNIQLEYYESQIFIPTLKNIIKFLIGKKTDWHISKRLFRNLLFRLRVPFIKNETIIMGFAPHNFRILWYKQLLKKNNLIYHTSHPFWCDKSSFPLKYRFIDEYLEVKWKIFIQNKKLKIVCVTKTSKNSLNKCYSPTNVFQIFHTVDVNRFSNDLVKSHDENNTINIIYVGKFLYQKGLDIIVELINRLDDKKYTFTFVGDGPYKKNIENIFKRDNVNYLGWISDKNVLAKIYSEQDLFLNPSIKINGWQELFGIVNIEAMASGLVVIASKHVGPKEIITNGFNGFLVEEKNINQYLDIIAAFNEKKMNEISQNAYNRAKEFQIDYISNQWKDVLEKG